MGGNFSRTVVRKAVRPIKNINIDERAQKAVAKHKVKPVAAPLHPTTKDIIERQVAEHPEIKEEMEKQDPSLIDRVNTLHVDMVEKMPQIRSVQRPLPQSREHIEDPLLALEEPRKIPKGKISFRQFGTILDKHSGEPKLHQAEVVAKEYELDLQDTINLLKYFEKIKLEDLGEVVDVKEFGAKWTYDPNKEKKPKLT
ncbi:NADH dehydrogenase [ubiquinone] 1 alpha subcomplex assembly factor 4-like [Mercenaria mercenaria]|uniref:NADH dehydrogenase [ubiquinone] 1 alpha subcomplex assembly factor 4-like n=1 Tax=Mercenaria mercenaria TaxID=6596 RepID=UPI00234E8F71|nr:NADH dehydrogenase [ubiquinone] 1 alpha subcomplex assembly factor 4-like [Mercenaria mercenaria]